MKKIILIVAFALTIIHNTNSQNITVSYFAGYGTYGMSDMKNLLDESLKEFPVDGQVINNFPGYLNHTIQAGYSVKEHYFGLEYGLMSTGGKISYFDYSGSLERCMDVKANKLGLYYKYHFYNQKMDENNLSFFAAISPGVMFSNLDITERLYLSNPYPTATGYENINTEEKVTFESTNFYIEPQLGVSFHFKKYFALQLSAGYEIGINQNMTGKSGYFTEGDNKIYINGLETNSKMDWSGFRAKAGITILLPTRKMD